MNIRSLFYVLAIAFAVAACSKDNPVDPGKNPGEEPGKEHEYTVDKDGYATYT